MEGGRTVGGVESWWVDGLRRDEPLGKDRSRSDNSTRNGLFTEETNGRNKKRRAASHSIESRVS